MARTVEYPDWPGLDHMYTPWNFEGLESAVPQLHGQRLGELRYPLRKMGCQTGKTKGCFPLQTLNLILPADGPWSSSLAFFLPQGTSQLLSSCWVLGLLSGARPFWGRLILRPRPELVLGCWDQKFAPQGMVIGAEGAVESLSFSSSHLPVILSSFSSRSLEGGGTHPCQL